MATYDEYSNQIVTLQTGKPALADVEGSGTLLFGGSLHGDSVKAALIMTPDVRESKPSLDFTFKTPKGVMAYLEIHVVQNSTDTTATFDPNHVQIEGLDVIKTPQGHGFRKASDSQDFSSATVLYDLLTLLDPSRPGLYPTWSQRLQRMAVSAQTVTIGILGVTTATNIRVIWGLVRGQRYQQALVNLRVRWRLVVITALGAGVLDFLGHNIPWPDPFPLPGFTPPPSEEEDGFVLVNHT